MWEKRPLRQIPVSGTVYQSIIHKTSRDEARRKTRKKKLRHCCSTATNPKRSKIRVEPKSKKYEWVYPRLTSQCPGDNKLLIFIPSTCKARGSMYILRSFPCCRSRTKFFPDYLIGNLR